MKGRDLLILGAVLLVAGSPWPMRSRGEGASAPRDGPGRRRRRPTRRRPRLSLRGPRAASRPVPGAAARSSSPQTGSCAVREVDLPSGLELRQLCRPLELRPLGGAGHVRRSRWASARRGDDTVPFRFVDLVAARPRPRRLRGPLRLRHLEPGRPAGRVVRALARRVRPRARREPGAASPTVRFAYTPDGEIAFADGDRLVVADAPCCAPRAASHSSTTGRTGRSASSSRVARIERWQNGRTAAVVRAAGALPRADAALSPDNCAAAVRAGDNMRFLDVGCSPFVTPNDAFRHLRQRGRRTDEWVVVAGPQEHHLRPAGAQGAPVTWPVGAADIFWRRS